MSTRRHVARREREKRHACGGEAQTADSRKNPRVRFPADSSAKFKCTPENKSQSNIQKTEKDYYVFIIKNHPIRLPVTSSVGSSSTPSSTPSAL